MKQKKFAPNWRLDQDVLIGVAQVKDLHNCRTGIEIESIRFPEAAFNLLPATKTKATDL
jgi:hypothetical protein